MFTGFKYIVILEFSVICIFNIKELLFSSQFRPAVRSMEMLWMGGGKVQGAKCSRADVRGRCFGGRCPGAIVRTPYTTADGAGLPN